MSETPVRGLVRRAVTAAEFEHRTWTAPPDLRPWVEHLWSVTWDRGDEPPLTSRVISFPAVNLTVEWGTDAVRHGQPMPATLVHGVVTEVFEVDLTGRGGVVGARFTAGGFGAWAGLDVAGLTDRVLPAADVLGARYANLDGDVRVAGSTPAQLDVLVAALRDHPGRVAPAPGLAELLARTAADASLIRVEQLSELTGWSLRTLQRRFRHDVGVSPKWALARFRLQQAALELERDGEVDLAELAVRLGWYDQAHFTRDFRRMLGETPGEYVARAHRSRDQPETSR